MRLSLTFSLGLMLSCFGAAAGAYDDLGLRPLVEDLARSTAGLGMSERLIEVDALLERLEGDPQAPDSLRRRLVALYAGSPLMKHRVHAVELAAPRKGEELSAERSLDQAQAYTYTFNPWEADRRFGRVVQQYPQWARGYRNLGNFLFERGATRLDEDMLAEAQAAFERAAACPDGGYDDWLGVAACMVGRGRREDLPRVVDRLRELDPDARATLLYGVVADWDLGFERSAAAQLREVLAGLSTSTARYFVEVEDFLLSRAPLQLDDAALQPPPPRGALAWQIRLIESEALFCDRAQERHGWESATGEAWLLYGRPLSHVFVPPFRWSPGHEPDADEILTRLPGMERYRDYLFRAMDHISSANGIWIWVVQLGERHIPYVFMQNAAFAKWDHNPTAHQVFFEPMKHSLPLNLVPPEATATTAISTRHATFRAGAAATRIECAVAVGGEERVPDGALRWQLRAKEDSLVSELERPLTELTPRGVLLSQVVKSSRANVRLAQLAAIVGAGEYLSRVELLRPDGSTVEGDEELIIVSAMENGFGMSELLLADSFRRLDTAPADAEFVRHAIEVVPHPEHAAFSEPQELYVYYEIYDAQLDEHGNANLDVQYQIFEAAGFDPFEIGSEGAALVDLRYRDEHTGISPGGAMVRGSLVPIEGLDPGEYVLAVSVSDRLQRAQAHRTLRFAR